MKLVSIITVNYNQKKVTEDLILSIRTHNEYPRIELIVVDNASKDNPVPEWDARYSDIQFIRSEINLGFAGGNNLGIARAKGDYLFLINNDTEITKGLVSELVQTLESNQKAGMVSPKIRYFDKPDILQYAGFTPMNYVTARNRCIGLLEKDNGQHDGNTGETGFCHGAAMMVKREAMEKAGLMAEHYFLYYEEMDWCEHFRKAGYTIMVNMRALIYHKESVSVGVNSPLKEYFMNRNRILFIRRNCRFPVTGIFWLYFLCVVSPRNLAGYLMNKRNDLALAFLKALAWNMTHSTESTELGYKLSN